VVVIVNQSAQQLDFALAIVAFICLKQQMFSQAIFNVSAKINKLIAPPKQCTPKQLLLNILCHTRPQITCRSTNFYCAGKILKDTRSTLRCP
jgi:hypothetical protein